MLSLLYVILVGGILLWLNSLPKGVFISNFFLIVLFAFASARLNQSLGIFYSIMILIVIFYSFVGLGEKDSDSSTFLGIRISGIFNSLLMVLVGFIIYIVMRGVSSSQGGMIIGVPSLAVTSNSLLTELSPMLVGALGYIENRFFFVIFDVFRKYILPYIPLGFVQMLGFFSPLLFTSFAFGFFHSVFLNGFVIFAAMIMMLWLILYILGFAEATSIAHYLWNSTLELGRVGLRIL